MFKKTANTKYTASASEAGFVVVMYDDGWEDIVSMTMTCADKAAGMAWLAANGFEEYDANAGLKAAGFAWNGHCYGKEAAAMAA